jgi:hypothetical protein
MSTQTVSIIDFSGFFTKRNGMKYLFESLEKDDGGSIVINKMRETVEKIELMASNCTNTKNS